MKILEREIQFNRFSVLIELNDGNGMRLSFKESPTDEEVFTEVQRIIDAEIEMQKQIIDGTSSN